MQRTKRALGVPGSVQVEARLYKCLLYEPGGHFAPHRDTEKESGMFATLVVLLQSDYQVGRGLQLPVVVEVD